MSSAGAARKYENTFYCKRTHSNELGWRHSQVREGERESMSEALRRQESWPCSPLVPVLFFFFFFCFSSFFFFFFVFYRCLQETRQLTAQPALPASVSLYSVYGIGQVSPSLYLWLFLHLHLHLCLHLYPCLWLCLYLHLHLRLYLHLYQWAWHWLSIFKTISGID